MDISLKMYKMFLDVTREKNISRVAEQHFISQPALSLKLKKLEESYGVKLLERTMKGVEPTQAGWMLADYAKKMLKLYQQSFEEISDLKNQYQTIRIEANLTLATYVMPLIVYRLQNTDFGKCFFDLTYNTTEPVESNILNGLCQIGFVQKVKDNPNLIYQKVAEDYLTVVAASDYDIPDVLTFEELKKYPMIEVFDKFQERISVNETLAFYQKSMDDFSVVMSLHSTESVKTALTEKIGIAMLPYISVKGKIKNGDFKQIHVQGLQQKYPVYMVCLKERQYLSVQENVIQYLKYHTQDFFEQEPWQEKENVKWGNEL